MIFLTFNSLRCNKKKFEELDLCLDADNVLNMAYLGLFIRADGMVFTIFLTISRNTKNTKYLQLTPPECAMSLRTAMSWSLTGTWETASGLLSGGAAPLRVTAGHRTKSSGPEESSLGRSFVNRSWRWRISSISFPGRKQPTRRAVGVLRGSLIFNY